MFDSSVLHCGFDCVAQDGIDNCKHGLHPRRLAGRPGTWTPSPGCGLTLHEGISSFLDLVH